MIQFQHVYMEYSRDNFALQDVSFSIAAGELIFLSGPSGAGKSTLLKLIAGVEKASSGSVFVSGQDLSLLKPASLPYLRRKLGLILQGQDLLSDRSVLANVMLPLIVVGASHDEAEKRAMTALENCS